MLVPVLVALGVVVGVPAGVRVNVAVRVGVYAGRLPVNCMLSMNIVFVPGLSNCIRKDFIACRSMTLSPYAGVYWSRESDESSIDTCCQAVPLIVPPVALFENLSPSPLFEVDSSTCMKNPVPFGPFMSNSILFAPV